MTKFETKMANYFDKFVKEITIEPKTAPVVDSEAHPLSKNATKKNLLADQSDYISFGKNTPCHDGTKGMNDATRVVNNSTDFSLLLNSDKILNVTIEDGDYVSKFEYHKLETKLQRFQQELGDRVHSESRLQDQVKILKTEVEGLKKLLENNEYYTELKDTISDISEAIFNASKNKQLKDEHQTLLKNLLSDSLSAKIEVLEKQAKDLEQDLTQLKQKLKDEIRRSHEAYGITRKYISTIKNCAKMQKDFVDISDYINNAALDTGDDLDHIEHMQLLSTQNNNLVRNLTDRDPDISISHDVQTSSLQRALEEKEKYIKELERKLKSDSFKGRRAMSLFKNPIITTNKNKEEVNSDSDCVKSCLSTKHIQEMPSLLAKPASSKKRAQYKFKGKSDSKYDIESLQSMYENEPEPEPIPFLEVDGIISTFPAPARK